MFVNYKIYKQIKFSIFFALIIANNNNNVEAAKSQITIGQYFFPRVAFLPNYDWNTNAHLLTEPISAEVFHLPQQQQHKQQQKHQNMNEQDKAQLYPIPVKIFYKNRFNSLQDIRRSDQQLLFYNKKTGQYITRNDINETRIVTPQDETMTDIRIGINFNNSDNIHEAIINKTPALILLQNRSYRYDGFGGHITVDFTDEDSSKVKNKESTWINMR
ncbi:unnamed protein product, partial [Onchocerca ochengi]|uniref:Secreted protein n=1 Tax=Onchocerca ochengi TaxID=42157 RepID=A0A182EFP8_ONCOC